MTITSFDALFYTLSFVVPGFLWNSTFLIFVPRKVDDTGTAFLRHLTFSCFNYALWIWLIYLVVKTPFFTQHPIRTAMAWFMIIFISPVALGVIAGRFSQREWLRNLLTRMGFGSLHPIPTAWDYYFSKVVPVWVIVTTTDNAEFAGFFGGNSFASSTASERDLYIEKVFEIVDGGGWREVDRTGGILIKGDKIKHIEFRI